MSRSAPLPEIGERAQILFKALVERYISDGQPVGSRALSRELDLNLSPATIRNVMADLEDLGLIAAPHTSAGRVPTVSGYRFFVDSLVTVQPLQEDVVHHMRQSLGAQDGEDALLQSATRILSGLSHMAAVITLSRRQVPRLIFRQVEFLPLSQGRILVILVTNQQEVHNRIIQPERAFSPAELQTAANALNALFSGRDMSQVRQTLLQDLQDTKANMDRELVQAAEIARLALDVGPSVRRDDLWLSGQTNLMTFAELSSLERLRDLFEAFNRKRDIVDLLDRCLEADGVQIFIGKESGCKPLDSCSLVTAPYVVDGAAVGVLGVIGPTRMEYERIIPLVDITARLLGSALNHQIQPT